MFIRGAERIFFQAIRVSVGPWFIKILGKSFDVYTHFASQHQFEDKRKYRHVPEIMLKKGSTAQNYMLICADQGQQIMSITHYFYMLLYMLLVCCITLIPLQNCS